MIGGGSFGAMARKMSLPRALILRARVSTSNTSEVRGRASVCPCSQLLHRRLLSPITTATLFQNPHTAWRILPSSLSRLSKGSTEGGHMVNCLRLAGVLTAF